jgi:hypothetical protein
MATVDNVFVRAGRGGRQKEQYKRHAYPSSMALFTGIHVVQCELRWNRCQKVKRPTNPNCDRARTQAELCCGEPTEKMGGYYYWCTRDVCLRFVLRAWAGVSFSLFVRFCAECDRACVRACVRT